MRPATSGPIPQCRFETQRVAAPLERTGDRQWSPLPRLLSQSLRPVWPVCRGLPEGERPAGAELYQTRLRHGRQFCCCSTVEPIQVRHEGAACRACVGTWRLVHCPSKTRLYPRCPDIIGATGTCFDGYHLDSSNVSDFGFSMNINRVGRENRYDLPSRKHPLYLAPHSEANVREESVQRVSGDRFDGRLRFRQANICSSRRKKDFGLERCRVHIAAQSGPDSEPGRDRQGLCFSREGNPRGGHHHRGPEPPECKLPHRTSAIRPRCAATPTSPPR